MKEYKHSPWGPVQYQTAITDDITWVGTAGHGGCKVSPKLNKTIPDYLRNEDGWYEEDCDWSKVFVALEAHILLANMDACSAKIINAGDHKTTLLAYYPDAFEQFYGVPVEPGQSYTRDKQLFAKKHANDYIAVSASTDKNDPNMVIVTACIGGRNENGQYNAPVWEFHVTSEEYKTRSKHGFVIDPKRHPILV